MLFVVDADDPDLERYRAAVPIVVVPPLGNMVAALNAGAREVISLLDPKHIGFVGDDHRFRSSAWDVRVVAELDAMGGGLVYGDDLAWQDRLCTQVFMSSSIIKALGWMALPTCRHLYVDNAWMMLGKGISHMKYLPDVIIEHLHPAFGKAEWDEGHIRVNSDEMYSHDRAAYEHWLQGDFPNDLDRVLSALS